MSDDVPRAPGTPAIGSGNKPITAETLGDYMWLRRCELVIGDKEGKALNLSDFRITFRVTRGDSATPPAADIRIYNLSKDTAALIQKEFTHVILQAGYRSPSLYGVIFDGEVKRYRSGRESPTETYLDIAAADMDQAHNYATVSQSLAAGYTQDDVRKSLSAALKPYGVLDGYLPPIGGNRSPRGRVLYGMVREHARDLAATNNVSWSVNDRQFQIIPASGYVPGTAVVLNSRTGLIGMPQQTMDGIQAQSLLNPNFRVGRHVKIDQESVQQMPFAQQFSAAASNERQPSIASDGFYRILAVDHSGDTFGQPWYSEIWCASMDPSDFGPTTRINTVDQN